MRRCPSEPDSDRTKSSGRLLRGCSATEGPWPGGCVWPRCQRRQGPRPVRRSSPKLSQTWPWPTPFAAIVCRWRSSALVENVRHVVAGQGWAQGKWETSRSPALMVDVPDVLAHLHRFCEYCSVLLHPATNTRAFAIRVSGGCCSLRSVLGMARDSWAVTGPRWVTLRRGRWASREKHLWKSQSMSLSAISAAVVSWCRIRKRLPMTVLARDSSSS